MELRKAIKIRKTHIKWTRSGRAQSNKINTFLCVFKQVLYFYLFLVIFCCCCSPCISSNPCEQVCTFMLFCVCLSLSRRPFLLYCGQSLRPILSHRFLISTTEQRDSCSARCHAFEIECDKSGLKWVYSSFISSTQFIDDADTDAWVLTSSSAAAQECRHCCVHFSTSHHHQHTPMQTHFDLLPLFSRFFFCFTVCLRGRCYLQFYLVASSINDKLCPSYQWQFDTKHNLKIWILTNFIAAISVMHVEILWNEWNCLKILWKKWILNHFIHGRFRFFRLKVIYVSKTLRLEWRERERENVNNRCTKNRRTPRANCNGCANSEHWR